MNAGCVDKHRLGNVFLQNDPVAVCDWLKTQRENPSVSALHGIVVETTIRPTRPRIQDA